MPTIMRLRGQIAFLALLKPVYARADFSSCYLRAWLAAEGSMIRIASCSTQKTLSLINNIAYMNTNLFSSYLPTAFFMCRCKSRVLVSLRVKQQQSRKSNTDQQ